MRLNSTRLIDLKMKSDFNKTRILRLCSDLSFMINHRENPKYCMINIKINKTCYTIDDTMKKDYSLNRI